MMKVAKYRRASNPSAIQDPATLVPRVRNRLRTQLQAAPSMRVCGHKGRFDRRHGSFNVENRG